MCTGRVSESYVNCTQDSILVVNHADIRSKYLKKEIVHFLIIHSQLRREDFCLDLILALSPEMSFMKKSLLHLQHFDISSLLFFTCTEPHRCTNKIILTLSQEKYAWTLNPCYISLKVIDPFLQPNQPTSCWVTSDEEVKLKSHFQ